MNQQQPAHQTRPASTGRWRVTYLMLGLAVILLVVAWLVSAWRGQQNHERNLPRPGLEAVVVALRAFHQQTGRFPQDFRELDARLWQHAKQAQISADGQALTAPAAHYYYILHVSPPVAGTKSATPRAGLWAVPTGPRAHEAATHFWSLTPTTLERWMGPALTAENVGAVKTWPTEQQLALLVLTRQGGPSATGQKATSLWSFLF